MTREEKQKAIDVLKKSVPVFPLKNPEEYNDHYQTIQQVIDWLEQEPSADNVVSRENVKEQMIKYGFHAPDMTVTEFVEDLPPVTPKQRIGKWIKSRDSYGNNHFTCPFCEHDIATKADTLGDNYCSNCGAKLQESEPQESEE